jgi:hypothetical protein
MSRHRHGPISIEDLKPSQKPPFILLRKAVVTGGRRLTKPNHPWTNGQVERMNRTLKEATVRRYHYETHDQLREHLDTFLAAYNFAKRLKTLRGLTPYEFICKCWTENPDQFRLDPTHHKMGLNN